jgi:hypothetical protein
VLRSPGSEVVSSAHYCKEIAPKRLLSCNILTSNRRISAICGLFALFFRIDYFTESPGAPPWQLGHLRRWISDPLAPYSYPQFPQRKT